MSGREELALRASDGTIYDEAALVNLPDEVIETGTLYYGDPEADEWIQVTLGDDGQLYHVEAEAEATAAGEEFGSDDQDEALLRMYFEQTDDVGEALRKYHAHLNAAAQVEATVGEEGEEYLVDFLEEHPDALANFNALRPFIQQTGDLDKAYELWRRGEDVIQEERAKQGGPDSQRHTFESAWDAWQVEKTAEAQERTGGHLAQAEAAAADLARRQAKAEAIAPENRTVEDNAVLGARVNTLDGAMSDLMDELGAANDLRAAARHRIAIENQQSKGR